MQVLSNITKVGNATSDYQNGNQRKGAFCTPPAARAPEVIGTASHQAPESSIPPKRKSVIKHCPTFYLNFLNTVTQSKRNDWSELIQQHPGYRIQRFQHKIK